MCVWYFKIISFWIFASENQKSIMYIFVCVYLWMSVNFIMIFMQQHWHWSVSMWQFPYSQKQKQKPFHGCHFKTVQNMKQVIANLLMTETCANLQNQVHWEKTSRGIPRGLFKRRKEYFVIRLIFLSNLPYYRLSINIFHIWFIFISFGQLCHHIWLEMIYIYIYIHIYIYMKSYTSFCCS